MSELSTEARTVLGSVFGWGAVLTYHMIDSVPSPEMQAALDELFEAGIVVREVGSDDMPSHGKAVRYRLYPGFDVEPYRREAAQSIFDNKAPSIRVFMPRTEVTL